MRQFRWVRWCGCPAGMTHCGVILRVLTAKKTRQARSTTGLCLREVCQGDDRKSICLKFCLPLKISYKEVTKLTGRYILNVLFRISIIILFFPFFRNVTCSIISHLLVRIHSHLLLREEGHRIKFLIHKSLEKNLVQFFIINECMASVIQIKWILQIDDNWGGHHNTQRSGALFVF